MKKGADVNAKDNCGDTELMKAAEKGELEVVKYLVKKEANVNAKNICGDTSLLKAKKSKNLKVERYLKERRANVNTKRSLSKINSGFSRPQSERILSF